MEDYIKGLVSVVMPTYKRSDQLCRAIDSVLNQTYTNIELLLVNDNEPNDSFTANLLRTVEKYQTDSRFHLILQERHINGAVARNVGIRQARGEYIAFLDDDDWWENVKIEHQVQKLNQLSDEWGVVSCKIRRYKDEKVIAALPRYDNGYVYKDILMLMADYATGTLLIRHTALDDAGYFDEELLRHQDLQLLVNITYKYKLFQLNEYLHCCDIGDAQNRPDVEKIIRTKKAFFNSINDIYCTLSKKEKRDIKLMNNAEIGYVLLKNKQYLKAISMFLPLLTSVKAFSCEIKKVYQKVWSKKNA